MVNGLNVVPWAGILDMVSSIQQELKCGRGAPVFTSCKSWISFGIDVSYTLSTTDYNTQINFISNSISKMNHPENILRRFCLQLECDSNFMYSAYAALKTPRSSPLELWCS